MGRREAFERMKATIHEQIEDCQRQQDIASRSIVWIWLIVVGIAVTMIACLFIWGPS